MIYAYKTQDIASCKTLVFLIEFFKKTFEKKISTPQKNNMLNSPACKDLILCIISAGQSAPQSSPRTLSTGDKQEHPSHVPEYLPAFPDPHSYIRSEVSTVKPVISGQSKRRPKLVFKTDYRSMHFKSIAECSKRSILQYFQPSLSYHLSLFCLFLSGHLRQVLL